MSRHGGAARADAQGDDDNTPDVAAVSDNSALLRMLEELQRRLDNFNRHVHKRGPRYP